MQQATFRLSSERLAWLNAKLEVSFAEQGKETQVELDALDWPEIPLE